MKFVVHGSGVIWGEVRTPSGEIEAGMDLRVWGEKVSPSQPQLKTDAQGSYRLERLISGRYYIQPAEGAGSERVDLERGQVLRRDILVDARRPATLCGAIRDEKTGLPIADAHVRGGRLLDYEDTPACREEEGRYEMAFRGGGNVKLEFSAEGYQGAYVLKELVPGPNVLDVTLVPSSEVTCHLTIRLEDEESGGPIDHARVECLDPRWSGLVETTAGAVGEHTFQVFSGEHTVDVEPPAPWPNRRASVQVPSGAREHRVTLRLPRAGLVVGTVHSPGGGLAYVSVADGAAVEILADGKAEFSLRAAPGTQVVSAHFSGDTKLDRHVTVSAGQESRVDFVAPGGRTRLLGRVLMAEAALFSISVVLERSVAGEAGLSRYRTQAGDAGRYEFLALPAGSYRAIVQLDGYDTTARPVVLAEGGAQTLDLEGPAVGHITIRVIEEGSNRDVSGNACISVVRPSDGKELLFKGEGDLWLDGEEWPWALPAGTYRLTIGGQGYQGVAESLVVPANGTVERTVRLRRK